jgi:transcriptional regulator with XRE-family HTH domain
MKISIEITEDYTQQLQERLVRYKISKGELSRESGIDQRQISRWTNTSTLPRLESIQRIELAIATIRARRERAGGKTARKRKPKKDTK